MLMSDFRPLVELGFLFVWVTGSLVRRRPTVLHGLFSCFCLGHVTLQGMDSPENSHVSQERAENKQFPPRMMISVVICECSGQQVIVFFQFSGRPPLGLRKVSAMGCHGDSRSSESQM